MHAAESKGPSARAAAIAKLTVYHLAALVETETALDGAELERYDQTERYDSTDREFIAEVLGRIERAVSQPTSDVCDVRWGLVFSDFLPRRLRQHGNPQRRNGGCPRHQFDRLAA
jgi:hypothetical protein